MTNRMHHATPSRNGAAVTPQSGRARGGAKGPSLMKWFSGEYLRKLMEAEVVTVQEMSALLERDKIPKSSVASVRRWCKGEAIPDIIQAQGLAKALGVTLDQLCNSQPVELVAPKSEKRKMIDESVEELGDDEAFRRLLGVYDVDKEPLPVRSIKGGRKRPGNT